MKSIPLTLAMVSGVLLPLAATAKSQLEEMTVTASRTEMPLREVGASLSVITAEDITARGQDTVADLLRTMPSINVSSNGGLGKTTSLRIRGEEGFRTKVLIDGVDVSDSSGTQVQPQIQHIMTANIERIEILRGPQGMMYGADSGGVINIITKKGDKPIQGDIAAEYGRYNTRQLSGNLRGKIDIFDYSLIYSDTSTDGFNTRISDTVLADDDGYDNKTYGFSSGVNVTDAFRIQLTGRDTESDNEFDQCFNAVTSSSSTDCTGTFDQTNGKIDLIYNSGNFDNTLSYAQTDTQRKNYADGSVKTLDTSGKIEQAQYQGGYKLLESVKIIYGLDWQDQSLDNEFGKSQRNQKGIYSEWQGNLDNRFFYTVGVRHDDNDDFGEFTSYRLTTAYVVDINADNSIKLRASAGNGFRAPSLYEIAYNGSAAAYPPASLVTLREETSRGGDIGIDYFHASGANVSLTYFNQTVDDEIDFDLAGFSGYLQEDGTTKSTGLELAFETPLAQAVSVYGNYTYNDTENAEGKQRIRRPRNTANLGIAFRAFNDQLQLNIDGRMVRDAVDEIFGVGYVSLDNYETLAFNLSYAFSPNVEVYVRGENILGEDYVEVTGYNTAGASTYGGFRLHF